MHTRLLTLCHHLFQAGIIPDTESDGDLIQQIHIQNRLQILCSADHLHTPVSLSPGLMVIQNPPDLIPPFRIRLHPVNIALRCPAVAD